MPTIKRRPKKRRRINKCSGSEGSLDSRGMHFNLDLNVRYDLNGNEELVSNETQLAKLDENLESKGNSVIIKGIDLNLDSNSKTEAQTEFKLSTVAKKMVTNTVLEEPSPNEREFDLNVEFGNSLFCEATGDCVSNQITSCVDNEEGSELDACGISPSTYKIDDETIPGIEVLDITSSCAQSEPRRRGRPKGRRKSVENACQISNSSVITPQFNAPVNKNDKQLKRITRSNAIKRSNCRGEPFITSPTIVLPPSSKRPDLSGLPILDIFSVYACLRTFNMLLFLSPFELDDFVESLRIEFPNFLFDSIHVSILRSFKKHLERLSSEGSLSAADCLRSLNWNFLDDTTWPIFLVEYFVIHGFCSQPKHSFVELNILKNGYHKLPASVKIEVLRCLCDEMMEMETFRSEINKRSSGCEWETAFDRNGSSNIPKKRRVDVSFSRASCFSEETAEYSDDWNSDECILCKMDGTLICCDGCPAAYHAKCIGIANESLPDGDWYCRECFANRNKTWKNTYNSLSAAELLGTDFLGQLYFSCCGYLLVSYKLDSEKACKYYHSDDVRTLVDVLRTSVMNSWELVEVICKAFMIPTSSCGDSGSLSSVACKSRPEASSSDIYGHENLHEMDVNEKSSQVDHKSEGSDENIRLIVENVEKNKHGNVFDVLTEQPGTVKSFGENSLMPVKVDAERAFLNSLDKNIDGAGTDYVNWYSFGSTAALFVEDLMSQRRGKLSGERILTEEEIISAEMKIISKIFPGFCLPTSLKLPNDVLKQKCGWCFFCRAATYNNECLFNLKHEVFAEPHSGREAKICNPTNFFNELKRSLLFLFERLRGLLRDPFQDPLYSQKWLDLVKNVSDLNSLKFLLLKLEERLHPSALSSEWWRSTDSATKTGSACHFVMNLVGRKRKVRLLDAVSNPSRSNGGLNMFWWRGGSLSRRLFSWKLVPRSILLKAARQGGFSQLPGVFYADNSDLARRMKFTEWRASVESSFSVEHLALQIRELDARIKWDEIWNIQALCLMDKKFKKSYRLFKKASICKNSKDGDGMKYLLDFGKRKLIPEVISKNGLPAKESSGVRRKYWVHESFIPLFLFKTFRPKRILHKINSELTPKLAKRKGLAYLFEKAERTQKVLCAHCQKDVVKSEAVYCQYCKDLFHKVHVLRFGGSVLKNVVYTCHQCNSGKSPKTLINNSSNNDQENSLRKSARLCGKRVCTFSNHKKRKPALQNNKSAVLIKTKFRKRRSLACYSFWLKGVLFSRKVNDEEILKFRKERILDSKSAKCCLCGQMGSFPCISCECCGEWFHSDAFGLAEANMANVIGFRCHLCRKSVAPQCFHRPLTEL